MMVSWMKIPRKGYLGQLYHIFPFLKNKHNFDMEFDLYEPEIDGMIFGRQDWRDTVYREISEEIQCNEPE